MTFRRCISFVLLFLQPSDQQLLAFAHRRLRVCQSPLLLKLDYWDKIHILDHLGPALKDTNIQLVTCAISPSVMD